MQGVPNQHIYDRHDDGLPCLFFPLFDSLKYKSLYFFFCQFILNFSLFFITNIQAVFNWLRVNIMASNYSQLHLATISDANSEMIYCCKNCERWSKGADWCRSKEITTETFTN